MRATQEQHNARKCEMMGKCFDCYAENGLTGTGIKALAAACGCTTGNLYSYFSSVDELIIGINGILHGKGRGRLYGDGAHRPQGCCPVCERGPVLDSQKNTAKNIG